jgi:hypothetical protein
LKSTLTEPLLLRYPAKDTEGEMTEPVNVDMAQLRTTCAAVRIDVEQGLRPGIADTSNKVQLGVRFAQGSPSGEADAARRALIATMQRHRENGEQHLSTADNLVSALEQILANYADGDAAARLDVTTITAMLDTLLPQRPIIGQLPQ